jgi:hypothetical protein
LGAAQERVAASFDHSDRRYIYERVWRAQYFKPDSCAGNSKRELRIGDSGGKGHGMELKR